MKIFGEELEFTWDMIRTIPRVYHYTSQGEQIQVHCKPNLEQLYKLFTPLVKVERYKREHDTTAYGKERPAFTLEEWTPPPLKDMFKGALEFQNNKPTVTIHNKFHTEWHYRKPVIFFSEEFVLKLVEILSPHYNIVYIRPTPGLKGFTYDGQGIHPNNDLKILSERYPEVFTIQKLLEIQPDLDYNTAQFILLASSEKHLAVAGGNACVSAYFGGDLLIYNCPDCDSKDRGVWDTDSWLSLLGGSKVYGYKSYDSIIDHITSNWLD